MKYVLAFIIIGWAAIYASGAAASFKFSPTEKQCETICQTTPNGTVVCRTVCR